MFGSKKGTIFARMTEVRRPEYPMVACSDTKETKKGGKAEEKEKPARQLNIKEAANGGFILRGPNWDEKEAACENKASLLAAVDAAFPEAKADKTEKSE